MQIQKSAKRPDQSEISFYTEISQNYCSKIFRKDLLDIFEVDHENIAHHL